MVLQKTSVPCQICHLLLSLHVMTQAGVDKNVVQTKDSLYYNYVIFLPSVKAFVYRNKLEFTFSDKRWLTTEEIASGEKFDTSFALGMHAPGRYNRVIDLSEC